MEITLLEKQIEKNLREEILLILGKPKEAAEKYTILGSDINQIRHIFYYLKRERIPIRVYYSIDSYTGFILNVEDTIAEINILGFEETAHRRLMLSFNFMNHLYQFEVTIQKVVKETIFFYLPLNIQYVSRRKYPRFFPKNLYAKINIEYQNLFSQKEYEQLFCHQYPFIHNELIKPNPDLGIMIRIYLKDLNLISTHFDFFF
ncbi:MAG: hypothetical protein ACK4UJ_07865 [Leptonema sp. (in: bacteria)]